MTQPQNTLIVEIEHDVLKVYNSATQSTDTIARGSIPYTAQVGDTVIFHPTGEVVWIPKHGTSASPGDVNVNVVTKHYGALKPVNKLAFILLAVLLGGLGIHKFYEGKAGLGILYLLFCWTGIPFIIGLIEGIVAIGRPADSNGNFITP